MQEASNSSPYLASISTWLRVCLINSELGTFLYLFTACVSLVKNAELTYLATKMFLWSESYYKDGFRLHKYKLFFRMMYLSAVPEGLYLCNSWPFY